MDCKFGLNPVLQKNIYIGKNNKITVLLKLLFFLVLGKIEIFRWEIKRH